MVSYDLQTPGLNMTRQAYDLYSGSLSQFQCLSELRMRLNISPYLVYPVHRENSPRRLSPACIP